MYHLKWKPASISMYYSHTQPIFVSIRIFKAKRPHSVAMRQNRIELINLRR